MDQGEQKRVVDLDGGGERLALELLRAVVRVPRSAAIPAVLRNRTARSTAPTCRQVSAASRRNGSASSTLSIDSPISPSA
jgi:hypothetical protein